MTELVGVLDHRRMHLYRNRGITLKDLGFTQPLAITTCGHTELPFFPFPNYQFAW